MARAVPLDVERELVEAFRQSGRASEYLVEVLPKALWRADPPSGRGRTIAAVVTHVQSVRRTFAHMGGARPVPPRLDRRVSTPLEARRALRRSTEALASLFEAAFAARRARVAGMPRRAVNLLVYLIQHDAHHRGQICALARDLGHVLEAADVMRLWGWKALPPAR